MAIRLTSILLAALLSGAMSPGIAQTDDARQCDGPNMDRYQYSMENNPNFAERHIQVGQFTQEVPQALLATWINAHEEDTEDFRVYRRKGYPLPRSRGREGFSIEPDGRFELHRIANSDGIEVVAGRWQLATDGDVLTLKASMESSEENTLYLRIESLSTDKLVLRK